jgi:hypothetical protein
MWILSKHWKFLIMDQLTFAIIYASITIYNPILLSWLLYEVLLPNYLPPFLAFIKV